MKMLMIDHMLPNNRYSAELCGALNKTINIDLVCALDSRNMLSSIRCRKCFPVLFGSSHGRKTVLSYLQYLSGIIRLVTIIITGRYDAVHIQTFKRYQPEMFLYKFLKRIGFIKVMGFTVHNVVQHSPSKNEAVAYRRFYNKCDLLVVHNDLSRLELEKNYPSVLTPVIVMPHGCYEKNIELRHSKGNPVQFLSLGGMRKNKGINITLEAASLLEPSYRKRCQIIIAGSKDRDNDVDYINVAKELAISMFVSVRQEFIEDDELERLHNEADYCLFPYLNIYGSGALLMAYSYDKPVVASDIPAFVEETDYGKTGFLARSGDAEAFAQAIRDAIDASDSKYADLVQNVDALRREKYNWKKSSEIFINAYERVCFG